MLSFLKGLLSIALIALLGYGLYSVATQNANDSKKILRVRADNTATIVGTVLQNKNNCGEQSAAGSKCFLLLRVGAKDVYVIYSTDDTGFCKNEETAAIGKNIRAGTTVAAYGFYRRDGNLDTILTCPIADYFIKPQ